MRYCSNCGTALPEGATACPSCGSPVAVGQPEAGYQPVSGYAPPSGTPPPGYAAPGYAASGPSAAGLTSSSAAALSYVFGIISGAIFLLLDPYKQDRFVRFHAFQSIFFNVAYIVVMVAWTILGGLLVALTHGIFLMVQLPVTMLLSLTALIVWVYLIISAAQGKSVQLPVVGRLAAKQANTSI